MNAPKIIDTEEQGDSQVVVLPPDVRLPGGQVEATKSGDTVTLRAVQKRKPPMTKEQFEAWVSDMERFRGVPFMEGGREQPPMPSGDHIKLE